MIAAASGSARLKGTQAVQAAVTKMASGAGKSTIFATGGKLAAPEAALVNCAYSIAQDFDDIIWMGHTCHSAVFASLAVAEHEGSGTRAFDGGGDRQ